MIKFRVVPDRGSPYEVTATARDVLVWERTNKGRKVFSQLMEQMSYVDLYQLAWIASRRLGHYGGELRDFETECEVVPEEDDEADPTRPAPSTGT